MAGIRHDIISSVMAHSVLLAAALLIGGSSEIRKASQITISLFDEQESSSAGKQTASAGAMQGMRAVPAPKTALKAVAALSAAQPVVSRQDPEPLAPVQHQSDTDRDSGPAGAGIGEQSNSSRAGGSSPSSVGNQTSRSSSGEAGAALASRAQKGQGTDTGTDISVRQRIRDALQANLVYPYIARKRGMEGTVHVEFLINTAGIPKDIRIIKGSGYQILDSAARETVLKASPFAYRNGLIAVPITYQLIQKTE
ncbi:MAG: energy transducer TonB [Nitrospirae bacterium]|nr:energy transducer TonB [Nitrospirota bacterium]